MSGGMTFLRNKRALDEEVANFERISCLLLMACFQHQHFVLRKYKYDGVVYGVVEKDERGHDFI